MDQKTEETVFQMTDFVSSPRCNYQEFVDLMKKEHRTLQQSFTRLCVEWLEGLAGTPENHYDSRNEASVRLAKEFILKIENRYLPSIVYDLYRTKIS